MKTGRPCASGYILGIDATIADRMIIYLDSCSYNRPYDDQTQLRVYLEARSKMRIQQEIIEGKHKLVTSIILDYENSRNRDETSAFQIQEFMDKNSCRYVDVEEFKTVIPLRDEIMSHGIKTVDASHLACAVCSGCDYFITTDDRILKFKDERVKVISPVGFISLEEE